MLLTRGIYNFEPNGLVISCSSSSQMLISGIATTITPALVYSIEHYVIKFVNDLREVGVFFPGTPASSTSKTDRHNIT